MTHRLEPGPGRGMPSVRLGIPSGHEARRLAVLVVVLAVGATLAVSPAPVWLRAVLALPALVLGSGVALGLLLLRPERHGDAGDIGGLLWWALTVLLGLLVALADALLLDLLRIRLTTLAVAVGIEVIGAALLVLGQVSFGGDTLAAGARLPDVGRSGAVRAATMAAVTVAVLVGAVVAARERQPGTQVAYGVLSLTGGDQTGELGATAGEAVTVGWQLRGYEGLDVARAGSLTGVSVTDLSAGGTRSSAAAITHAGPVSASSAMRTGTTTFTAPRAAGTYRLAFALSVPDASAGGTSELGVTANLTVRP